MMQHWGNPEQEKPYELVPFAAEQPKRSGVPGHHEINSGLLTGRLVLRLGMRSPVQVASGSFQVTQTPDGDEILAQQSEVTRLEQGERTLVPVLPGSSLKGALRSMVETLSPSCVMVSSRKTRDAIPTQLKPCTQVQRLCPACQLFGMSGRERENYQGQITVEDALLKDGKPVIVRVPILWSPARGQVGLPGRYLQQGRARGRKIYRHSEIAHDVDARVALRAGSRLQGRIHFQNVTPAQLGLLITALGLHPDYSFLMKIGAGKPVGMGSVETNIPRVDLCTAISANGRMGGGIQRLTGAELKVHIAEWVQAGLAEGLIVEETLQEVHDLLREENLQRAAVEQPY